jgi:hypothetical protein
MTTYMVYSAADEDGLAEQWFVLGRYSSLQAALKAVDGKHDIWRIARVEILSEKDWKSND